MDEEVLNIQVRKFLKKVGIQSQREIEQAVKDHLKKGSLSGTEKNQFEDGRMKTQVIIKRSITMT